MRPLLKDMAALLVPPLTVGLGLALILVVRSVRAEAGEESPLAARAKVVILGDSITHQGRIIRFVCEGAMTRFPGEGLKIFNAGIGGDTVERATKRLDRDIYSTGAQTVAIALGMNDVRRSLYVTPNPDEKTLAARQAALDRFRVELGQLVQTLLQRGLRVWLVTPTPTDDQFAHATRAPYFGANQGLAGLSQVVREIASEHRLVLIDLHRPMTAAMRELAAIDCEATLVGKDRVHPQTVGAWIAAQEFLKGLGWPQSSRAEVAIDFPGRAVAKARGAAVSDLSFDNEGISWRYLPQSLPQPPPPDELNRQLSLFQAWEKRHAEILQISDAPAGSYEMIANNTPLGTFSSQELANGVDLSQLSHWPPSLQTADVQNKIFQAVKVMTAIRDVRYVELRLDRSGVDPRDDLAVDAALQALVKKKPHAKARVATYRRMKGKIESAKQEEEALWSAARQAAKPEPVSLQVRRKN